MLNETSSPAGVQDPVKPVVQVAPATTAPPPASEGQETPPPEEHKVTQPPELTTEQIETLLESKQGQAAIYRAGQSMKDRELAQERLKHQQEEDQRRREQMDDEEYGGYVRAEEKRLSTRQLDVKRALKGLIGQMQEQAVSVISNKKVREAMAAKSSEYDSFPEFARACAKAETDYQVDLRMTKRERELTESLTEKIRAEQVGQLYPQLGTGLATAPLADLHGTSAIGAGLAAELAKKRKEG